MVAGLCSAPSLAQAASPYVSANVGLGFAGDTSVTSGGVTVDNAISYKTGIPFGGAVGLKGNEYRVEAALEYVTNKVDNFAGMFASNGDKVSIFSYMANAYYDYSMKDSSITPYVMGGLGGASIEPKAADGTTGTSKSVFAWQLGAGVGVKATDNIVVDLGYRYFKPSAYKDTDFKATFSSSNILLGVRYNF